jgi:flagellar biosynthesis protein FlhF
MQIRTYTASSMKDALTLVKSELGSDAVIISTREVSSNNYGIMGKPMIEVVAAVDYDGDTFLKNAGSRKIISGTPSPDMLGRPALTDPGQKHLSHEIVELKQMLKTFMNQSGISSEPENPVREKLLSRGIRSSLVDLIVSKLGRDTGEDAVKDLLSKLLRTQPPSEDRIWIFLGTTGVGKTTTIAKIAARATLNENKRVALLTLDAYRIGAIDQSRIYAKILNIPFFSVTTPAEFKLALKQLTTMDLILVDTVGRSPFSNDYLYQLTSYFESVPACRFLLMPVATRDQEMDTITKTYSRLKVDRMIFTKADEAHFSGSMITHNLLYRTPISYITTGQRVPEDIESATTSQIIATTLGDAR